MKRITLTGAHSTGKTTLLDYFLERKGSVRVGTITEVARKIINSGFPLGMEANTHSYARYIHDQFRLERTRSSQGFDLLVSDRSVLDIVAYSRVNEQLGIIKYPEYFNDCYYEIWLRTHGFYDLHVFFPIEYDLVLDDVRPETVEYQRLVSEEIFSLINQHDISFLTLKGSVSERFETLKQYVDSIL